MNAQGINQPQRPPQDLSFAYLTLVIAPWEPTLQGGLFLQKLHQTPPNINRNEGKQCPN